MLLLLVVVVVVVVVIVRLAVLCGRCVFLSVCLSVSRIIHKRVNGRRPNMTDMDKG